MSKITAFGSSSCPADSQLYNDAIEVCSYLASEGYSIVTGAYYGIMEAALFGAFSYNVDRIGVTTEFYKNKLPNKYVKSPINSEDYNDRLLKLIELGDNYIVFDGGTGTLLELSYIWAMKSRGELKNKKIILFGSNWYNLLHIYSDLNIEAKKNLRHLIFADNIEELKKLM